MLNEGGEDSMSTPNMSFDSPIIMTKSSFGGLIKNKELTTLTVPELPPRIEDSSEMDSLEVKDSKLEDDKPSKKKDMFAPEADMFAEEYNVSSNFIYMLTLLLPFLN